MLQICNNPDKSGGELRVTLTLRIPIPASHMECGRLTGRAPLRADARSPLGFMLSCFLTICCRPPYGIVHYLLQYN